MARKRIGEILIQAGVLDNAGLRTALTEQRRWGGPLGRTLVDMKLVTEEALVQALSHQLNFPIADLDNISISADVLALVPGELADQHSLVPFHRDGKFLDVAMSDPTNLGIIDELRIRTQLNVRSHLAGPKTIERALVRFYGTGEQTIEAQARAAQLERYRGPMIDPTQVAKQVDREAEIQALQARISQLEALVSRDEDVLRKLLGLLVEKGIATREEILERLR